MLIPKRVWAEGERVGGVNSHSTVGGIRDVVEEEKVVELFSDDILCLAPGAGITRGGQSQRN